MDGKTIVRPFFPNGDYQAIEYNVNDVVIDNPPFSIITQIARFYISKGVKFFLFAPHLTVFSPDIDCTHIVVGADITYENGAVVKTSFLSNMLGDLKVVGEAKLHSSLKAINEKKKVNLPKYVYPPNVLTVSMVAYMVEKGVSFELTKDHVTHCRMLDSQKKHGKALFGSGFLISEKAAAEKAAAEKAAAEKENVIVWELSDRERKLIGSLGDKG